MLWWIEKRLPLHSSVCFVVQFLLNFHVNFVLESSFVSDLCLSKPPDSRFVSHICVSELSPLHLLSSPPVLHRFASWPPATDDAEADVITASQHPWHSCTAIFPAFRLPDGQTDGRPSEHPAPILLFIRAAPRSSLHTTPSLPLFSNWRTAAEAEARRTIHVWVREGKWCCRLTKG